MRLWRVIFIYAVIVLVASFSAAIVLAATSPWSQTNWSGGSGQTDFTDSTKYSSASNVVTSTSNQVTLTSTTSSGSGADGAITVSSDKNINSDNMISGRSCSDGGDAVNYSVTSSISSGASSVTLSSTPATGCLTAGDEVLIINLQGTSGDNSNVGKFETATIQSISTATLTLSGTLSNAYDGTTQKIMVQRVPNYSNVTVNGSTTLTASAWNGTKGGVLFFRANGTVTVTGTISTAGKGYAGGAAVGQNTNGRQGEGTAGAAGTQSTSANGNGGGGGVGTQDSGSGAGGGYAAAGTNGIASGAHAGGTGGSAVGSASLPTLFFGGGGGSGGGDEDGTTSGAGGNGGGIITVNAGTLTISGSITANGATGGNSVQSSGCGMGAGGGGAGGSILLNATNATLGSSLATATAGSGGTSSGCGTNGGAGAVGRIAIYSPNSISGTTNPTYGTATNIYVTSGTLTSSIFDSGYTTSTTWGTLTFAATTPTNTTATVKVRSGGEANLSDATAFSSCTAISSGTSASANSCASTGRYSQYLITLSTSDTSATPTFTSFSLAFSGSSVPPSPPVILGITNSGPPTCTAQAPSGTPDLFQIDPGQNSVNLHFKTVSGTTGYKTSYGLSAEANQYGDSFDYSGPLWILDRQINNLIPNTTYYFKVQPLNDCNAGSFSQTVSAKTTGGGQISTNLSLSSPAAVSASGSVESVSKIISKVPVVNEIVSDKKIEVQNIQQTPKPNIFSYVVKEGDSLWSIASKFLGTSMKFPEIADLNPGIDFNKLVAGMKVKIDLSKLTPAQLAEVAPEVDPKKGGYDLDVKVLADAGTPLSGVKVTLHSIPKTSVTNNDGVAHFSGVEGGKHKIYLAYSGYDGGGQAVNVTGDNKNIELVMQIKLTAGLSMEKVIIVVIFLLAVIVGLVVYIVRNKRKNH